MAEWITTTLEECTDILGDGLHGTPKYTENGEYAFVNGNNLVDSEILIKKETKRVDYSQYDKYKKPLTNRTILVSINGTLGNVGVYGSEKIILGKSACYFNVKESVDKDFIYYIVSSPTFKQYLESNATGTTIKNISLKQMRKYTFELPEIGEQKRISYVLRKIDEKIKNNRAINNNLEQQAQALFKSWFVDFEPFDGELPSSWTNEKLGNVCNCVLGGTPSRAKPEYWNGTIPWINSGEVNNFRIIKPSETITELGLTKSATKLLPLKTTVIAITGATLGQVSLLEIDACANQSVVGIIPNDDYPYEYIYPLIKQSINELTSHQTGGAQQHINKQNVESLDILVPTAADLDKYCNTVHNLYEMIATNCFENEYLTSLRDTLLPKLMSGELDVSGIDL